MNEIGCIKVDVAMNDSAYYAHAPMTASPFRWRPAICKESSTR